MLRLVLLFFFLFFYVKLKCEGLSGSRSICPLAVSLRGNMVSSLQWLLLLWGLGGLWAEEHGEKYKVGSIRRRNRQLPPNVIAPNGKCKSKQLCCSSCVVWNVLRLTSFMNLVTIYKCIRNWTCSGRWSPLGLMVRDLIYPSPSVLLLAEYFILPGSRFLGQILSNELFL